MNDFIGDFLGFSIGKFHSSKLNITRVSSGDRYLENITPNFNDATVQIPGADGTYYWDTFYTQRPFVIDFAFDNLDNDNIKQMRQIFNFKGFQPLIFDEARHKKYMVKCSQPPTLKYIAFDNEETTIYKGEGTLNLVAYYPFGIGVQELSLPKSNFNIIPNAGELATPFQVYFSLGNSKLTTTLSLVGRNKEPIIGKTLTITDLQKIGKDDSICIDMRTHLIEGIENGQKTGHLYNQYITEGDFFTAPLGQNYLKSDNVKWEKVIYNYLYY